MIQRNIKEFGTLKEATKFIDSKDFIKLLNANEIELVGDFYIAIHHDEDALCYTVQLIMDRGAL